MTYYVLSSYTCPWCDKAIDAIKNTGEDYQVLLYTNHPITKKLMVKAGLTTVPQIWHDTEYIGGYEQLTKFIANKE